jgi:hypothetical protein
MLSVRDCDDCLCDCINCIIIIIIIIIISMLLVASLTNRKI